jgi:hypothetical protein
LECGKEKITTEEINNNLLLSTDEKGRNVWHMVLEDGFLEALEKVWVWAKKQLTLEEINKLLLATDHKGRTVWHVAAKLYNLFLLEKLCQWSK